MSFIGNLIWIIFGGLLFWLEWVAAGILCCITIIGIPLGKQCFKFAKLSLCPFGKEVKFGGGAVSLLANIIWLAACGLPMAITNGAVGLVYCITIIGIPFGKQCFKLAKLSLMPIGASVE